MQYQVKIDAGKHRNEVHIINSKGEVVKKFEGVDREYLAKQWMEKRQNK